MTRKTIVEIENGELKHKGEKTDEAKKEANRIRSIALASELGFSFLVPLLAGIFLGKYLDGKYGTSPKITLICIGAALFISGYSVYLVLKELLKK